VQWALQIANTSDDSVPKVWSLSWGIGENQFDQFVGVGAQSRINIELAKMGIRGLTLVVASGDAGVRPIGRSISDCGEFLPDFPASSHYVLTVGATMLASPSWMTASEPKAADLPICDLPMSGHSISCDETGLDEAIEISVSCCDLGAVWTAGAGFSNNYSRPAWQESAVMGYMSTMKDNLPPSNLWNATGRAYPDIAMIGDKVPTVMYGSLTNFGGTSASAPITAGVLTLLNAALLARGKSPVGPVTPLLYSIAANNQTLNPFNDITIGHNRCGEMACCPDGFECSKGWDAVTGLGSMNFAVIRDIMLAA